MDTSLWQHFCVNQLSARIVVILFGEFKKELYNTGNLHDDFSPIYHSK
jgi:hypothetical protein